MNDNKKKRQRIFDNYADHLQLLIKEELLTGEVASERVYICPLCLAPFKTVDDEKNPLTLEDAPPKALGGKANILTCKKCNNTAGTQIDSHLVERLRELDNWELKPGSELKVKIKIGNDVFAATLTVDSGGKMKVFHSLKNNNPEKLRQAMSQVKVGTELNPEFKSRVIPENLEYALLKSAYLSAFRMFGYSLMLPDFKNAANPLPHSQYPQTEYALS